MAALLALPRPCLAEGVAPASATPAQRKSASKRLADGKKLLQAGKVDQALAAFEAAHDAVAEPESALMIARTQQSMGELVEAHAAYSRAVSEAEAAARNDEKYRETLRAAKRELAELEGVLARLTIRLRYAPEGTHVTIDGEPLGARKLGEPILMSPGQIKLVAQTPDGREASRQVTLTAGQDAKVELAFVRQDAEQDSPLVAAKVDRDVAASREEPEPPHSGSGTRTGAFIAGGVGVAGLATFGVLGAMSNAKYHDLEAACPNARCSSDQRANIDDGKRYQTLANVGLAVGVAGLGTSVVLFFVGKPSRAEPTAARAELRLGLRSITLWGSFQ